MSSKKKAQRQNSVSVASLQPFDKDGWMTKQGGSVKSWNKRYFVLKDKALYYFKGTKDTSFTGKIDLESTSSVKADPEVKKSPHVFQISTSQRVFFMYADRSDEMKSWVDSIQRAIDKIGGGGRGDSDAPQRDSSKPANTSQVVSSTSSGASSTSPSNTQVSKPVNSSTSSAVSNVGQDPMSPRVRLSLAKAVVNFLKDPESKVLEFWQIWSESIPAREDLTQGMNIEFQVATTADMQKLTWRTSGPQNIFIQKMVDFFWNVGAPETEIDRLNDVGALINPIRIGSWIDMSAKGGMDGGWFFPEEMPFRRAIQSADKGDAVDRFEKWADTHGITNIYAVGRDMGAAPPRQTELKLKIPGIDFTDQLNIALDAFSAFEFPPIPENALKILRDSRPDGQLTLSVITSAEGFVRLGLLAPNPRTETVLQLCAICGGSSEEMASFEASLGKEAPSFVEYQHLMKNFGYGVYKEGFDVVFHYIVGEEVA